MQPSRIRKVVASCVLGVAVAFAAMAAIPSQPFRCPLPDGVLEIPIPPGWESNPRLAGDNSVLAFLDPAGLKIGEDVPICLTVDRRARDSGASFLDQARSIIDEGKGYGFAPRDSATIRTADGRTVYTYAFRVEGDSLHRGLGILESPQGAILLRYQAATETIWSKDGWAVNAILKGLRLAKE